MTQIFLPDGIRSLEVKQPMRINPWWLALLLPVAFLWPAATFLYNLRPTPDNMLFELRSVQSDMPPNYLLINGERWSVIPYDFDKYSQPTTEGAAQCGSNAIWIDTRPHTKPERREIMWHEIVHANYCYKGAQMNDTWAAYVKDHAEHEAVYQMGVFLPGFVHDNPEFMKWAETW